MKRIKQGRKEGRERTNIVSCIQLSTILGQVADDVVVAPHSRHVKRRLSILVGSVERAPSLIEALHYVLVTMPTATEQGGIAILCVHVRVVLLKKDIDGWDHQNGLQQPHI